MTYLMPPNGRTNREISSADLICSLSQQTHNQTSGSPTLTASAGDTIALRYQENGHITLPQQNPPGKVNAGDVYVYGTATSSATDTLASIHGVWNARGTSGDSRGRLLTTRAFDDGRCYQINNGSISRDRQLRFPHAVDPLQGQNLWCKIDVVLPDNLEPGTLYSLYWVWDWSTYLGDKAAQLQMYTTCIDVQIQRD